MNKKSAIKFISLILITCFGIYIFANDDFSSMSIQEINIKLEQVKNRIIDITSKYGNASENEKILFENEVTKIRNELIQLKDELMKRECDENKV